MSVFRAADVLGAGVRLTAGSASSASRVSAWESDPCTCVVANGAALSVATLVVLSAKEAGGDALRPMPCECRVRPLHGCAHSAEVMDVACFAPRAVASVDAIGTLCLSRVTNEDDESVSAATVVAPTTPCEEMGPTSVAVSVAGAAATVARARAFDRVCDIVDAGAGRSVWSLCVPEWPWAVAWAGPQLLAVAEGRSVALFDPRAATCSAALRHRLDDAAQQLRCVAWDPRSGVVLAGGDDRGIRAVDPRSGAAVGRWPGCAKTGVAGILPSAAAPEQHWCYARGTDSQVVSGEWGRKRGRGTTANGGAQLRVDSRWAGLCLQQNVGDGGDTLYGWTAAGSLYMVTHAETILRRSAAGADEGEEERDDE